jgi:tetratricopeptide (TPR) repeat protein
VRNGSAIKAVTLAVCLGAIALVAGCARRSATMPPVPVTLRHPDFHYPTVPKETDAAQATRVERAWRYLQSNNLRAAERELQDALKAQPAFIPAETAMGYVELARRDAKDAAVRFGRALENQKTYAPALVGRGLALLELGRSGDALASFEAAVKADKSLTDLQARIEVLRFRAVQDSLARAKSAGDAGRLDEARAAYQQAIAASPDSGFLHRELALIERRAGDTTSALDHFRRAVALDPTDARSHAQIGGLLEEAGDLTRALAAYEKARSIDPAEVSPDHVARLRDAEAAAKLPAEYRAIGSAPSATRADVAALIGVRLAALLGQTRQRQAVVTDVRGHWAQQWILPVVRAGVMDTQPNYTFQPGARVRRGDLAQTVSRVLALIAARKPAAAKLWQGAKVKIADVAPGHLSYAAVSQAVASGVMPLDAQNTFDLLRPVTGSDLVDIVGRLEVIGKP